MHKKFIPSHGGYKSLISYQKAEIVYDATYILRRGFMQKDAHRSDGASSAFWQAEHC